MNYQSYEDTSSAEFCSNEMVIEFYSISVDGSLSVFHNSVDYLWEMVWYKCDVVLMEMH